MTRKKQKKRPQAIRRKTKESTSKNWELGLSFKGTGISLLWKALTITGLVVAPAVIAVGTYKWIKNPENLTIETVEVTGVLNVLNKELLEPVIKPFTKTNLHLLDTKGLEEAIEKHEWVDSASLTKVWPDKLIVKVREEKPVAFWGQKAMLSQEGKIIKAVLPEKKGILPLLYSPENKGRNMASEFLRIRELMKEFPVKLVEFKEDARGSWQIKLENGLIVKIGRHQHEKRMKRFMVGYKQKLEKDVNKIHTVDLRYTNGFAVKWKKGRSADRLNKGRKS